MFTLGSRTKTLNKYTICIVFVIKLYCTLRLSVLEGDGGSDRYAAGRFDFDRLAAVAVAFARDGCRLDSVQGVRLQPGDVALERVGDVESQRFIEQRIILNNTNTLLLTNTSRQPYGNPALELPRPWPLGRVCDNPG